MNTDEHSNFGLAACLAVCLFGCVTAAAQRDPHIGYVYPAGGQRGATIEALAGGQFLNGVTNAWISGAGIEVKVIEVTRPLNGRELTELRDKSRKLQEKRAAASRTTRNPPRSENPDKDSSSTNPVWTAEDEKLARQIRQKLARAQVQQANPALAETVALEISISPDAALGRRELRLGSLAGLSNPMVFCVGAFPEQAEEPGLTEPPPGYGRPNITASARPQAKKEVDFALPATLNGQIQPGGVDRYRFRASKGQKLVAVVQARELIPYLADAVPGWFQATVALLDESGRELAFADDFNSQPDPVLCHEIPSDGYYELQVRDAIYRGRDDFVYRLTAGEIPYITSIFPLGAKCGASVTVELEGWNLPARQVELNTATYSNGPVARIENELLPLPGGVTANYFFLGQGGLPSNPFPFVFSDLEECLEHEPNDQAAHAQTVPIPGIVNGRIQRPGDTDVFQFAGEAGQEIVFEIIARRLNSPLDSSLRLADASGHEIAFNDDHADKGAGLSSHHADSYLRATLPAVGNYFISVKDGAGQGGLAYGYRLRLSAPRPDFDLRVTPASINTRASASVPITVHAIRRDGFKGPIELSLELKEEDSSSSGLGLSGGIIPAEQEIVKATITAPRAPLKTPGNLVVRGKAEIAGRTIVREAVPADEMMQAFAYKHLVPAQELKLFAGPSQARVAPKITSQLPLRIPAGGQGVLQIQTARAGANETQLELNEPPEGITLDQVSFSKNGVELVFHSDPVKTKPGLKGNLIVQAFAVGPPVGRTNQPAANRFRRPLGVLPAIPFEVTEP